MVMPVLFGLPPAMVSRDQKVGIVSITLCRLHNVPELPYHCIGLVHLLKVKVIPLFMRYNICFTKRYNADAWVMFFNVLLCMCIGHHIMTGIFAVFNSVFCRYCYRRVAILIFFRTCVYL